MKTNNSYLKRLKVTKNGKVISRKAGKCHFNAKESRSKQLGASKMVSFTMKKADISRYLPHNQ
ncbi:MAG TPA: 50S ribosomal protein L35 [Candidatus Paceibacterota bacterium]|nr:50S ribosomal protein L35 [Candidatus Paceibacterota bacterium]